jgi:glutamate carboxypeptidase
MGSHYLLDWARARAQEMTAHLRELVEIESPSTDPAAVAALAARLAHDLAALGLAVEQVPVAGGGPLLLGRSPAAWLGHGGRAPTPPPRPVLLLGHLDTVWPLGTLASRPVRIADGRLHGPGSYDMKAGLTVVVFALRALAEKGGLPSVAVCFTPLEEVGCAPYRERMESEMKSAAAVLDFEPAWPGGAVKTERKGSGAVTLRARGRAAHAGADFEKGRNAIVELARRVLEASGFTDLARGVTVNVGVIRGGLRPNVVPDRAECEIDFRVRTLEDGRRVEAALKQLRSEDAGVTLEVEGGLHYPPLERAPHVVGLYEKARAVAAELEMDLAEVATGGASEASFAAALGIPTLDGLGADGDGAHAEHEHVLLSSLPERVALAAGLVRRLATESRV